WLVADAVGIGRRGQAALVDGARQAGGAADQDRRVVGDLDLQVVRREPDRVAVEVDRLHQARQIDGGGAVVVDRGQQLEGPGAVVAQRQGEHRRAGRRAAGV